MFKVLLCLLIPVLAVKHDIKTERPNRSRSFDDDNYDVECDELCEYRAFFGVEERNGNDTPGVLYVNDHHRHIHEVLYYVSLPVMCSLGIIAIITTLVVLNRKSMTTSTNSYLVALAFADLMVLILLLSRTMDIRLNFGYTFLVYMAYAEILLKICLLVSVWLTVILGVERYIAISQPLHANRLCTVRNARFVILGVYGAGLLCRFPDFFQFFVIWIYDPNTNLTHPTIERTQLFESVWYNTVQPWLVDGLITAVLPIILLTVLNVKLICEVRRSVLHMRPLITAYSPPTLISREEVKITVMLIAIIVIFFVLQAPYCICVAFLSNRMFKAVLSSSQHQHYMVFQDVAFLLVSMKTAMNFILYCWFSERFWTLFKTLFCCERCKVVPIKRGDGRAVTDSGSASATINHNTSARYSHILSKETTL